jgi:hypothetical protein
MMMEEDMSGATVTHKERKETKRKERQRKERKRALNCAPTVAVSAWVQAGPSLALLLLQSMNVHSPAIHARASCCCYTQLYYYSLSLSLSLITHFDSPYDAMFLMSGKKITMMLRYPFFFIDCFHCRSALAAVHFAISHPWSAAAAAATVALFIQFIRLFVCYCDLLSSLCIHMRKKYVPGNLFI